MPRSPRRRIRLATVAGELTTCPPPVGPTGLRRLDTSNGCQDHTVLPSASAPVVLRARSPLTAKAALRHQSRPTLPRPPHPAPRPSRSRYAPRVARDGVTSTSVWHF